MDNQDDTSNASKAKNTPKVKPRELLRIAAVNGNTIRALSRIEEKAKEPPIKGGARRKDSNGVTLQQEAFARAVGYEGKTLSQAYRETYNTTTTNDRTIWNQASAIGEKPNVAARITYWISKKPKPNSHSAEHIRGFILEQLNAIASDDKAKTNDRIKALELLGKVDFVALFKDRSVVESTVPDDPDAIRESIEALLKTDAA